MLGYAQILQHDTELRTEQRESVDVIEQSGDPLLALINDVLDLSKIEVGHLEVQNIAFDLTELLKGMSLMFQLRCKEKQLGWRIEGLDDRQIIVQGDEGKLRQVLINLLSNAVKFTDSGEVILRVSQEKHHFRFEVIDTGVGIKDKDQAAIFEPFQQGEDATVAGGTGLGLAIAQRHIQLMGGELTLESELGTGSCFYFTIPLPPITSDVSTAARDDGRQIVRLAEGYQVTALVADDNQENRESLAKILSLIGVSVIALAKDGQEALDQVRTEMPDIVFMDIRMPKMDGVSAAHQLWREFGQEQAKIVAISASALEHEQKRFLEIGFDAFIPKPFRVEKICQCLAQLLRVEYESAEPMSTADDERLPLELSELVLPETLFSRLKAAAELYSITELERYIDEVSQLGSDGRLLAENLRRLMKRYDMDAIIQMLSGVRHE